MNNQSPTFTETNNIIQTERLYYLAYSARFRPPIPEQAGHLFRSIPATPYHKISQLTAALVKIS